MVLSVASTWVLAEEDFLDTPPVREPSATSGAPAAPAAAVSSSKRLYPGGNDEEDLQVQAHIPEATLKTDSRYLQREVYKTLFNEELKEDGRESVEE